MNSVKKDLYKRLGIYGSHEEDPVPLKIRKMSRIFHKSGGKVSKKYQDRKFKERDKE